MFSHDFDAEAYATILVDIIRRLDPRIAIERLASQAPRNLIAHSPLGGIRPHELREMVIAKMTEQNLRQGDLCTF